MRVTQHISHNKTALPVSVHSQEGAVSDLTVPVELFVTYLSSGGALLDAEAVPTVDWVLGNAWLLGEGARVVTAETSFSVWC